MQMEIQIGRRFEPDLVADSFSLSSSVGRAVSRFITFGQVFFVHDLRAVMSSIFVGSITKGTCI